MTTLNVGLGSQSLSSLVTRSFRMVFNLFFHSFWIRKRLNTILNYLVTKEINPTFRGVDNDSVMLNTLETSS